MTTLGEEQELTAPSATLPAALQPWLRLQRWFRLLVVAALLWGCAVAVLVLTGDELVVPTVLLGCFAVPLAWAVRIHDRNQPAGVTSGLVARVFFYGGLLGFVSSALLERPISSASPAVFAGSVSVVEELAKLLVLVAATWRLRDKSARDGFVLGAAVGFGFAAFESTGYALGAFTGAGGSVGAAVGAVLSRAVMAPVTHGLWTAVTGAVLFGEARRGRFRPTLRLAVLVLAVVAIHAAWDLVPNIATGIDLRLLGGTAPLEALSRAFPSGAPFVVVVVDVLLRGGGLVLLGVLGLLLAHRVRRSFATGAPPLVTTATPARHVDAGANGAEIVAGRRAVRSRSGQRAGCQAPRRGGRQCDTAGAVDARPPRSTARRTVRDPHRRGVLPPGAP